MFRRSLTVTFASTALLLGACTSSTLGLGDSPTVSPALASLSPAAGTPSVDPKTSIALMFTMSMMTGMEMLVVVHEGTVTGAQVAGRSVWSTDRKTMTFTPSSSLKDKVTYVVHLSPSLRGSNGTMINMTGGSSMGGQSVTSGMMGAAAGGMMNGLLGPGMMGTGWQASDGTYGMVFTFTTA